MIMPPGALLSATVTVLIVLFYFYAGFRVGNLRGRHGIVPPSCSGHPEFERAYRVHMNTLEQMAITLPLLWVATLFPIIAPWLAPLIGLIWVAGRIVYLRGYMADPDQRLPGMFIGAISNLALLVIAIAGLAVRWLAVPL